MSIFFSLIIIFVDLITIALGLLFLLWAISTLTHLKTVPFVPAKTRVLPYIISALDLPPGAIMYELGSGDGRIIFACFKDQPRATYVGIDIHYFAVFLAKMKWRYIGKPAAITFKRANILNTDCSRASHVYTYLLPDFMDSILPKLEKELKPGTKLVSLQFKFSHKEPLEMRSFTPGLLREKSTNIYTYQF